MQRICLPDGEAGDKSVTVLAALASRRWRLLEFPAVELNLATRLASTVLFQLSARVVQHRIVLAMAFASASVKKGSMASAKKGSIAGRVSADLAAASFARTRSHSRALLPVASVSSAAGMVAEASRWSAAVVAEEAAVLRSRVAAARRVRFD